jgi:hypothetical protein
MDCALNVVYDFTAVQHMLQLGPECGICEIVDQKNASEQTPDVNATFIHSLPTRC